MRKPNPPPDSRLAIFGQNPLSSALILSDFLGTHLCRRVRKAMDRGVVEPAEILGGGPALDPETRRASSIEIDESTLASVEARLDEARAYLSARCGVPLGGREGAGFIRYSQGGFYRKHHDRAADADWPGAASRLISVIVFLNSASDEATPDTFCGGELVIYPGERPDRLCDPMTITPREGTLVAFDAERLHEVRPVAAGSRDVIVDWYY